MAAVVVIRWKDAYWVFANTLLTRQLRHWTEELPNNFGNISYTQTIVRSLMAAIMVYAVENRVISDNIDNKIIALVIINPMFLI